MSQDPKKPVSRESDKFMLRFPEGMREQVARAAEKNSRSMNSEIVARLAYSFEKDIEDWIDGASDPMGAGRYDKIADLIIQRLNGEQLLVQAKTTKIDDPQRKEILNRYAKGFDVAPSDKPAPIPPKRTRKPKAG